MRDYQLKPETRKIFEKLLLEGASLNDYIKNPIKIKGDTTTIYIVCKGILYECLIDTENLNLLTGTICAQWNGSKCSLYAIVTRNKITQSLHRFFTNCPKGKVVDHINGNSLDNRMSNLKVGTTGQNMLNKKRYKNSASGITNLLRKNNYCTVSLSRRFYDEEIAKELLEKATKLFQHYSDLDASKR